MTKSVLSVQPSVPVGKAAATLARRGFTALPVVNESGELIGIVTEADLIGNRFPITGQAVRAMGVGWKTVPQTGHAMGLQNPLGFAMPMLCCSPDFTQPDPVLLQAEIDREKRMIDLTAFFGGR